MHTTTKTTVKVNNSRGNNVFESNLDFLNNERFADKTDIFRKMCKLNHIMLFIILYSGKRLPRFKKWLSRRFRYFRGYGSKAWRTYLY